MLLAAIVAYLVATGTLVPGVLLLLVIVTFITAAGNIINDYYDADIDAINCPERPIPSGRITRRAALWYAVLLFLAGIAVSLFTTPICKSGLQSSIPCCSCSMQPGEMYAPCGEYRRGLPVRAACSFSAGRLPGMRVSST